MNVWEADSMSPSLLDRKDNLEYALILFVRDVADNWIGSTFIQPGGTPEYDAIYPTTWKELVSKHYLSEVHYKSIYKMTGYGWLTGMMLLGKKTDADFEARIGVLSAALKSTIKGRAADGFPFVEAVAKETGLPWGFISNVIDSKVFEYWFRRHGAQWYDYQSKEQLIRVPSEFGLPLL